MTDATIGNAVGNETVEALPMEGRNVADLLSIQPGVLYLRAGAGIYFDHFGEGIVNTFDQYGSFGLSTSLTNPSDVYTPETAPRFTGVRGL